MKKILLHIFGYTFSGIIILLAAAIPMGGLYYLGESIWYISTYDKSTGVVVSCSRKTFQGKWRTKYAPVVKTDSGANVTSKSYGSKASCYSKKGETVGLLINPMNKEDAVLNTFFDRWVMPLGLLSIPGLLLFFILGKDNAN